MQRVKMITSVFDAETIESHIKHAYTDAYYQFRDETMVWNHYQLTNRKKNLFALYEIYDDQCKSSPYTTVQLSFLHRMQ